MLKPCILFLLLLVLVGNLNAQSDKIGYGFKAGISLAQYDGPSEIGPNGEALESNASSSGFHIGASFKYKLGDLAGFRAELLYSQRGTAYKYDGPSYYVLRGNPPGLPPITLQGTRNQSINVANSFIDVPVSFYYKLKGFELSGGFNFGFLISSVGGGEIDFNGKSPITGHSVAPFNVTLDYNYKSDKAGEASTTTQDVNVDGRIYPIPTTLGAYYDFTVKDKDMFNSLDMGLVAGLSYFFNEGLFVGVRYLHGFGDVDRNEYDISLQNINSDQSFIRRADENKSSSWQFSVGFEF